MRVVMNWEEEQRFFVPNEDAEVARMAVRALATPPRKPVFVAGSGMLALDVLPEMPGAALTCVDISPFQIAFAGDLLEALRQCPTPLALRDWFQVRVFPQLQAFYATRGQHYTRENVFNALDTLFRIHMFQQQDRLDATRAALGRVRLEIMDMFAWLCRPEHNFDFAHLSNIVDYLPARAFAPLFTACAARNAPVMCIATTACRENVALTKAWLAAGYVPHPCHDALNTANRALGARQSLRQWMRTGEVLLLVPAGA